MFRLLRNAIRDVRSRFPVRATQPSSPSSDVSRRMVLQDANDALPVNGIQSLLDGLPDAALVLDLETRVLAANAAARAIFDTVDLGGPISRTSRNPVLATSVRTCLASSERVPFELVVTQQGERHLDGAVTRLKGFGGHAGIPALLIVLQDISEREALARMRMEFVANASHELRTPLTALSGFIETLRGPAKNDEVKRERFLGIMTEQAQRMSRLIDDLLMLSRVEMRVHLAPTAIADLNLVGAECVRIFSAHAQGDGTTLSLEPLEGGAYVQGDHDELVQAAQNLVQNALKYGRPGGRVILRVVSSGRESPRMVRLNVTDDGPGIAAEHLPRLTERFYRVSTAASREKGGTGLGLAIVKHIATRHGGRVEVASSPGEGSIFTLAIPAARAAAPSPG
jgi:two-component system, OmpR family, phosphate regulon sensor histidine kinase PhoR